VAPGDIRSRNAAVAAPLAVGLGGVRSIKHDTQGFQPLKQESRDLLFGVSSPHAHLIQCEALKVLQLKNYSLVVRQARQGVCEASQFLLQAVPVIR
jgi:hypothetical protein